MVKFQLIIISILFSTLLFSQNEPIKLEGNAQGTTYHITYYDSLGRDFQPEIEQILKNFDVETLESAKAVHISL